MNELNNNGFEWLAGYLDGCGRIAIGRSKRDSPARLDVVSIHREFLQEFIAIAGGTIQLRPSDNRGRRQKLYRWQLCGRPVGILLGNVGPFMRSSQRQRRVAKAIRECERRYSDSQTQQISKNKVTKHDNNEV